MTTQAEQATVEVVTVPGAVWDDYLNPLATGMEAALELPKAIWRKVGKGHQARYHDVPVAVVHELADYMEDRAGVLLSQGELENYERACHHAAASAARRMRDQADRTEAKA